MPELETFCTSCGVQLSGATGFCPECGAKQGLAQTAPPTPPSPILAPPKPSAGAQQNAAGFGPAANQAVAALAPPMPPATPQLVASTREASYRAGSIARFVGAVLYVLAALALVVGLILAIYAAAQDSPFRSNSDSATLSGVMIASFTVYVAATMCGLAAGLRVLGSYAIWRGVSQAASDAEGVG